MELVTYAVAGIINGNERGYLAQYDTGNLTGKAIYVLSDSASRSTKRLQAIAGRRQLKPLAEETLLDLPRGLQ